MGYLLAFEKLRKEDTSLAGGKGASLGEMINSGIPVPPGFVVLATAFDRFLEETDLNVEIDSILHKVNNKDVASVEKASEEIQALIMNIKFPADLKRDILIYYKQLKTKYVAVRSSATSEDSASAAWAGQLESYLNTTEKTLLVNIQKCWASLFTPRAIFYRFEKGLHETKISVAVVVQKMVNSEISGIAFSVHPVTEDRNQLIIEAGLGLGEAIVSGQITPDSYVVGKEPFRILDKNVNEQKRGMVRVVTGGNKWLEYTKKQATSQKLSDTEIFALSKLILKIETHYGFPCDIEWAKEGNKFYITQSRPITTLLGKKDSNSCKKDFYELMYSRDFCLPNIEIWCRGESTEPRRWTKKQQPVVPYIFFHNRGKIVDCYMSPRGIEWAKTEVRNLLKKDPLFVKRTVAEFEKSHKISGPIIRQEKELNHADLMQFIDEHLKEWPWFEGIWWLIEVLGEDKPDSPEYRMVQKARKETDEYGDACDHVLIKSLKKIFPKLGDLSTVLTIDEIRHKDIPLKRILEKRKKEYIYANARIFDNKSLEDVEKIFGIELEKQNTEGSKDALRGSPAYPGKIKARVKIILGRNQVGEMQAGTVLVSPMTTVDFLPAMQKAAGIITDEGGITCHAAIVAREMGKPCVIGTKIATRILKDGDMVEMDGGKGTIKIITND